MTTYDHTVQLKQKEDEKKNRISLNNLKSSSDCQKQPINAQSNNEESFAPPRPPSSNEDNNIFNTGILPALPLPALPEPTLIKPKEAYPNEEKLFRKSNGFKHKLNFDNEAYGETNINYENTYNSKNKNNDDDYRNGQFLNADTLNRLNGSSSIRQTSRDHSIPCIMPNKNYLAVDEEFNDSTTTSRNSFHMDKNHYIDSPKQYNNKSNRDRSSEVKITSNIVKLPSLLPHTDTVDERTNSLSQRLENKRQNRKKSLNLTPESTYRSNSSNQSDSNPKTQRTNLSFNTKTNSDSDDDVIVGSRRFIKNKL